MDLKLPKKMTIAYKPKLLQFETNTICNGGCTFCRYGSMKKRKPMPLYKIIDLLYHLGHRVDEVFPFSMQEPLLEPRLLQILSNVKLYNPRGLCSLYTNMSKYPEQTFKKIIQWGLLDTVTVSFYGGNKEVHNLMQPGSPYNQTKRYIKQFIKLRNKLGWVRPDIRMAYLITPESLPNLNKVLKEWTPLLKVGVFRFDSWNSRLPYNKEFENKFWGPHGKHEPCNQLWSGMYINCDGDMVPCCLDCDAEMKVGNVFDNYNLWWDSPRLNEIRTLHLEGRWDELPLCKSCTKWRYRENIIESVKAWHEKQEVAISVINR